MLDNSVAYTRYKFLGQEFLTWLWFMIEVNPEELVSIQENFTALTVGNRLVVENRHMGTMETVTIKGDGAGLEEARLALGKGAQVSEMHLSFQAGDHTWHFTLKGESLHLSTLKVPETGPSDSEDQWEGAILEKAFLYEKAVLLVQGLYQRFIQRRIHGEWGTLVVPEIKTWIARKER